MPRGSLTDFIGRDCTDRRKDDKIHPSCRAQSGAHADVLGRRWRDTCSSTSQAAPACDSRDEASHVLLTTKRILAFLTIAFRFLNPFLMRDSLHAAATSVPGSSSWTLSHESVEKCYGYGIDFVLGVVSTAHKNRPEGRDGRERRLSNGRSRLHQYRTRPGPTGSLLSLAFWCSCPALKEEHSSSHLLCEKML
jgi:hypothetical protein